MDLEQEIAAWDGKSAMDIAAVYNRHQDDPEFINTTISLIEDTAYEKGATWLLKTWLKAGNSIDKVQVEKVYSSINTLADWESRLHMLQSIPFMPIADNDKKKVELFLRVTLSDPNKFVRAWSYNGFYELARQYPDYSAEVKQFFTMAMNDEAASVKARIRNLMKKGF